MKGRLLLLAITAFSLSACQSNLFTNNTVTPKTKLTSNNNILDFGMNKNNISIPINIDNLKNSFSTKNTPVAPRIKDDIKSLSFAMCTDPGSPVTSRVTPLVSVNMGLGFLGDELQLNTTTLNNQSKPSIASDKDGNFIAVWESLNQDGSGNGIYAQRFDNFGKPLGVEFRVNTETSSDQQNPSVSMNSNGNFVIAWESLNQDGSANGVYAQRFDSSGNTLGSEFRANTFTTNSQENPSVALSDNGNFVIAWQSLVQDISGYGVYAQRFDNNGNMMGSEFEVDGNTVNNQDSPAVAIDSVGNFVITWSGEDFSTYDIFYKRYAADGSTIGAESLVNGSTFNAQMNPSIAMNYMGDFVITWQSNNQDGDGYGIYAKRYNKSGNMMGSEFQVNSFTTNSQTNPSISMSYEGRFVISWVSYNQDGDGYGIFSQLYRQDGSVEKSEFQTNTYTTSLQTNPSVTMFQDGNFITVWESYDQDTNGNGIFSQMYGTKKQFLLTNPPEGTLYATVSAWDGLNGTGNNITAGTEQIDVSFNSVTVDSSLNLIFNPTTPSVLQIAINLISTQVGTNDFLINIDQDNPKSSPAMSIDEAGEGLIVWVANNNDIWARKVRNYIPLGNDYKISDATTTLGREPSVSIKAGNGIVVWTETDGGNSIIKARKIINYQPVDSKFTVASVNSVNEKNPEVKISDKNGNGVVTWINEPNKLFYRSVLNNTTVNSPNEIQISSYGSLASSPKISLDRYGNGMIVWESSSNILYSKIISFVPDASDSFAYIPDNLVTFAGASPNIALNEAGDGFIVWEENTGTGQIRYSNVTNYTPNVTNILSSTLPLVSLFNDGSTPSVSLLNGKNAYIVWSQKDGSSSKIYTKKIINNVPDALDSLLTDTNSSDKFNPIIQIKPNGKGLIVWEDKRATGDIYGFNILDNFVAY